MTWYELAAQADAALANAFAEPCQYAQPGVSPASVSAVFHDPKSLPETVPGSELFAEGPFPGLVNSPAKGDAIYYTGPLAPAGGARYVVFQVNEETVGWFGLHLRKTND